MGAPATARERDRAYRLRRRRASGRRLSRADDLWLRSYASQHPSTSARAARNRRKEARHRADRPATKIPRRERDRAYRIRRKIREGKRTTKADRDWLRGYERARHGSKRRAADDGLDLAKALGEWLFGPDNSTIERVGWQREPAPGRPGIPIVRVRPVDSTYGVVAGHFESGTLQDIGAPSMPPSSGRAAAVRVQYDQGDGATRWVSVASYTDDWDLLGDDLSAEIAEAGDAYGAEGIAGIAVMVS